MERPHAVPPLPRTRQIPCFATQTDGGVGRALAGVAGLDRLHPSENPSNPLLRSQAECGLARVRPIEDNWKRNHQVDPEALATKMAVLDPANPGSSLQYTLAWIQTNPYKHGPSPSQTHDLDQPIPCHQRPHYRERDRKRDLRVV